MKNKRPWPKCKAVWSYFRVRVKQKISVFYWPATAARVHAFVYIPQRNWSNWFNISDPQDTHFLVLVVPRLFVSKPLWGITGLIVLKMAPLHPNEIWTVVFTKDRSNQSIYLFWKLRFWCFYLPVPSYFWPIPLPSFPPEAMRQRCLSLWQSGWEGRDKSGAVPPKFSKVVCLYSTCHLAWRLPMSTYFLNRGGLAEVFRAGMKLVHE